jgi:hypothetical protein
MKRRKTSSRLILAGLIFMFSASCSSNNAAPSQNDGSGSIDISADQEISSDQGASNTAQTDHEPDREAIERAWQNSPHANTYLVDDEGQNNTCAQCHAPTDWQPSMDTIPETCFTCKFELEDPPPYIPEETWHDIPCKVCHELDKHDEVQADYAWLAIAAIDEYEDIGSTTELCQKCHLAIEPVEGHLAVSIAGVHQDQTCTNCHDSHDTNANCANCHEDMDMTITGHDENHAGIGCNVCHESGPAEPGIDETSGDWTLFVPATDPPLLAPYSHNIVLESDCSRCHYSGNPWQLTVEP